MYDEAIARLFAHIEKLDQDIAFLQQERIAAREAIIRLGGNPDGNSLTITPLVMNPTPKGGGFRADFSGDS